MAVFRVERNKGYTVMSNHHLRNKELSLKAKGLLSQMLSLPEDWDYTLAGLSFINREKIDAIREAVKELERAGYIVRSRERDEKGRLRGADYVIFEQPQTPPVSDLPTLENPTLDNPTLEKPTQEKPTLENPTQLNKDIQKTNLPKKEKSNIDLSSTDSIPIHSLNPLPYDGEAAEPPERKRKEATDAYSVYEEIIKDNIEYDHFVRYGQVDKDRLDEIVSIILNLPYLLFVYLFDKIGAAIRLTPGADASEKLLQLGTGFAAAFSSIAPSLHPADLLIGIAGAVIIRLAVYMKGKNAKKYRKGMEYGSARWGGAEDIKPYIDPVFENNVLLTQTERLMMSSRPKQPKYARNKNILVIGGSGSGKTRFFVKPNLMQMHSSYVVTDPKGTVLIECGKLLQRGGYKIKVLNTINFKKSMKYNPFAYLRSEKDILKLVNTIIANTKGDGEKSGEDFWVKAEKLYYTALIGYIWYEAPDEEKNFTTLLEMINASEAREDDEDFKNPVDLMFERLEEKDPEHFAVKQYKKYKLAAGKTAKSILISCGARLAPFDIRELRELMETDEMELDTLGDRKTALFVIISDTDGTFNFVVSILYTQLFNLLCDKADDVYGGRLPVHVRCLLDEFANIGQIPKFEKLIATIRSREISASIILQSQSQLKAIYKDNADTIVGNCDTTLFLGGKEKTTLKEISEILGKETIDSFNTSETRGRELSHGLNYQKLGKELMTQDEIAVMDGGKCILQLRGVRPFFSDKYDITKHPKYKYLSDADPKNAFDMEKHIKRRPAIVKPDEVFDYYEIDVQEDAAP